MAEPQTTSSDEATIGGRWRWFVDGWTSRTHVHSTTDADSVVVELDLPEAQRVMTVRFMTTRRLLVAFMTDGHYLEPDELALAAAAANAWNTEQLVPMLSVWDVRGPHPCLAGVCVLPSISRMTQPEFDALADAWIEGARTMFIRCHQIFKL